MDTFREGITSLLGSRTEIAVLVAGVSSMGLEILAGRMVAPEFGSSIYTWGSIIGVFLAALSLGYWRGGKRAREASRGRLAVILLFAASYVAVVVLFGDLFLRASAQVPLPPRFAALTPVVLLFGPPVYMLGFISPYAAELSTASGTGESAGRVYAVGTMGSIVGAFGTTFFLVPWLSVEWIGAVLGGLLVVGSAALKLPRPGRSYVVHATAIVVFLLVAAVWSPSVVSLGGDVVYESQTPYQELQVVDRDGVRTLYLDEQPHSALDLSQPDRHVFDYTRYFHIPLLLREDVDRVLFVGGGGFTGPKVFREKYDVEVHVVEIDPEVVRVAKEYFGVREGPDMRIHTMDARRYLEQTELEFDVIVLDAYKKDKVPFHLTTREFMELTSSRMDSDGVLFANIISAPSGPASAFLRAEYRTVSSVYPRVYVFPTSGSGAVQNVELVATKSREKVTEEELLELNRVQDVGLNLSREISHYRGDIDVGGAPVLRDDRAPVARLMDPMMGMEYVVEMNGSA